MNGAGDCAATVATTVPGGRGNDGLPLVIASILELTARPGGHHRSPHGLSHDDDTL